MREPLKEYAHKVDNAEGEFIENYEIKPYFAHWKLAGIRLVVPQEEWPMIGDIAKMNPKLKVHGAYGFSYGNYHEFLVSEVYRYSTVRFASSIVTVGNLTPLATFLLRGVWDSTALADIEWAHSIRLQNVPSFRLEQTLLTALDRFSKESKIAIQLRHWRVSDDAYDIIDFINPLEGEKLQPLPPIQRIAKDKVSQRLYYYGERATEEVEAFLHFYRILEYYAHALTVKQLYKLKGSRRSEKRFARIADGMLRRKEDENLLGLLNTIGCKRIATQAHCNKVLDGGTVKELCRKLYKFRNSVVHAKEGFRAEVNVQSPLEERDLAREWKEITRALAVLAIAKHSENYTR